jgi:hypothetical protein
MHQHNIEENEIAVHPITLMLIIASPRLHPQGRGGASLSTGVWVLCTIRMPPIESLANEKQNCICT